MLLLTPFPTNLPRRWLARWFGRGTSWMQPSTLSTSMRPKSQIFVPPSYPSNVSITAQHILFYTPLTTLQVLRLPRSAIDKHTFPLKAELANKLSSISTELHQGFGIAVLRGLDRANFNDEEAVIAFAGISSYVAALRATDSYANQTLSQLILIHRPCPEHNTNNT
jgi:hypothetical protein